jgi:hypothetical protein
MIKHGQYLMIKVGGWKINKYIYAVYILILVYLKIVTVQ